ncbi:hypothetical protein CI109_107145 [Kwoniella shandongensis]|uniref:Uncharacterized protein n=1 Tax=Kwoniella shandongensis TaxID=1734106 RepID=A0A5M6C1T1_9TREE|nr:uncharacterized protein CI109_002428 [Kwoniella shandongensis]KAA5529087.1 hypothetical protein CI109_002428 [Kwoniella shandongensis]
MSSTSYDFSALLHSYQAALRSNSPDRLRSFVPTIHTHDTDVAPLPPSIFPPVVSLPPAINCLPSSSQPQREPLGTTTTVFDDLRDASGPSTYRIGSNEESTVNRRKTAHTRRACANCRSRKVKCDGRRPRCLSCTAGSLECTWTKESDRRCLPSMTEVTSLRAQNEAYQNKIENLERQLEAIRTQARITEDDDDRFESVETMINRLKIVDTDGGIRYYGPTSTFALLSEKGSPPQTTHITPGRYQPVLGSESSLSPDSDISLASVHPLQHLPEELDISIEEHDELLDLFDSYFAPWCLVADISAFRGDLQRTRGFTRTDAYSPLLHNAILGNAVRFSDSVDPRADVAFSTKAMEYALQECEKPMLSTVKGLLLLGTLQTIICREDLASLYFGMATSVAQSMGLHLNSAHLVRAGQLSQKQKQSRDSQFWSLYALDKLWSTALGRLPTLREFEVDEYVVDAKLDAVPWQPPRYRGMLQTVSRHPSYASTVFKETCKLLAIAGDINLRLYGITSFGEQSLKGSLASHFKTRLQDWKDQLPAGAHLAENPRDNATPALLLLHMYHWLLVILVVRPTSHGRLDHSSGDRSSIESSDQAAEAIVALLEVYDECIGLRYGPLTSTHIAYAAASVLLMSAVEAGATVERRQRKLASFDRCVTLIAKLRHIWAEQTVSILRDLREDWIPSHANNASTPGAGDSIVATTGVGDGGAGDMFGFLELFHDSLQPNPFHIPDLLHTFDYPSSQV